MTCNCEFHKQRRGKTINERASLGALIVTLEQQLPELEKLARKTPTKTMLVERLRVDAAKKQVPILKDRLDRAKEEYRHLTEKLDILKASDSALDRGTES